MTVLNKLIDFCFKGVDEEFISVDSDGTKWARLRRSRVAVFTESTLEKAVKYVLQYCYFKLGKRIFRQIIEIPMGSGPPSFFNNLFLNYYESRWIRQVGKSHIYLYHINHIC